MTFWPSFQASLTFIYLAFCECSLKVRKTASTTSLAEVADEEDDEDTVFHERQPEHQAQVGDQAEDDPEGQSKSVSITVPTSNPRARTSTLESISHFHSGSLANELHYSLPHSYLKETGWVVTVCSRISLVDYACRFYLLCRIQTSIGHVFLMIILRLF